MSAFVAGYIKNRRILFRCDNCPQCQDQLDPECTYAPSDCTRHELLTADLCNGCNHVPCQCDEADTKRKYPWED